MNFGLIETGSMKNRSKFNLSSGFMRQYSETTPSTEDEKPIRFTVWGLKINHIKPPKIRLIKIEERNNF